MAKRLSAPTMAVWLIALIVGAIGILNHLRVLNLRLGNEDFWLVAASLIPVVVANLFRGLQADRVAGPRKARLVSERGPAGRSLPRARGGAGVTRRRAA